MAHMRHFKKNVKKDGKGLLGGKFLEERHISNVEPVLGKAEQGPAETQFMQGTYKCSPVYSKENSQFILRHPGIEVEFPSMQV